MCQVATAKPHQLSDQERRREKFHSLFPGARPHFWLSADDEARFDGLLKERRDQK